MSLTRINPNLLRRILTSKKYSTAVAGEEYTAVAQYPEILDTSPVARRERKKQGEHDDLRNVKTVEEKQIRLNMPKYYGFKCYMFQEDRAPYDQLGLVQHVTRTHLVVDAGLPQYYSGVDVDGLCEEVKGDVQEVILVEHLNCSRQDNSTNRTDAAQTFRSNIVRSINRIILNCAAKQKEHLMDLQVDLNPRIESFWFAGGMDPPENIKRYRKGEEHRKHTENDPTDRAIQYIGNPMLQLRSKLPLRPIVSQGEIEGSSYDVPYFKYDPRVVGVSTTHRHATNIPGFWPGEKSKFGFMSVHDTSHISYRDYNDPEESKEAVHRQGILASFAWLNAQANYLGFTTFNDVTYPLVTQTVLTDGKQFSFYMYQLNTLLVHSKHIKENPQRNVCWTTPALKLFEEIEGGKLVGFNDDVLKILLRLYLNAPQERLGVNMTPYLSQEEKVSADYEDADKRKWLEREYKFLMANRPRYKLDYEVYNWEKIYKIDHKTRPMEARRRPFELFQKPSDRKLNERQPFYIPRALRPDLPRYKGRYAKEYFP